MEKNENTIIHRDSLNSFNDGTYNDKKHIDWSQENELILAEWCDIAQCYAWLHKESYKKYCSLNLFFTLPTIILSTLTGTISFIQNIFDEKTKFKISVIIGSVNISIGVLTTLNQYFKVSEYNEKHRNSYLSWGKLSRFIRIELSKPPKQRGEATLFIKTCRKDYEKLIEDSPIISDDVIRKFFKIFSGKENTEERLLFNNLNKPDICNTLISINESRRNWYLNDDEENNIHQNCIINDTLRINIPFTPTATNRYSIINEISKPFFIKNIDIDKENNIIIDKDNISPSKQSRQSRNTSLHRYNSISKDLTSQYNSPSKNIISNTNTNTKSKNNYVIQSQLSKSSKSSPTQTQLPSRDNSFTLTNFREPILFNNINTQKSIIDKPNNIIFPSEILKNELNKTKSEEDTKSEENKSEETKSEETKSEANKSDEFNTIL